MPHDVDRAVAGRDQALLRFNAEEGEHRVRQVLRPDARVIDLGRGRIAGAMHVAALDPAAREGD